MFFLSSLNVCFDYTCLTDVSLSRNHFVDLQSFHFILMMSDFTTLKILSDTKVFITNSSCRSTHFLIDWVSLWYKSLILLLNFYQRWTAACSLFLKLFLHWCETFYAVFRIMLLRIRSSFLVNSMIMLCVISALNVLNTIIINLKFLLRHLVSQRNECDWWKTQH